MANQLDSSGHTINEVAAATIAAGTFAFTASGIAKFYSTNGTDSQPAVAGATVAPYVGGVSVWVDKATAANVFAQGAAVYGDESAQNALTSGGDGTLGYAAEPSANGDLRVLVRLTN